MDRTTVLAIGLFALAWAIIIYQSRKEDWSVSRTVGMLVFLGGGTAGVFLDNFFSAGSSLLPWIEPIAAVIMLVGLFIAWIGKRGEDKRSA
ncbi:hypothetical protein M0R88_01145 [Halorussus gelatinilyticus]|uniref:Uncharacterized protein n=1 Tax=Halorussus gelatinilyticus TaxID=2937524 RepID=A0A8U0II82_9EURY|nr:hypothetical protein [Halorussus gelatinilyticus]UPW00723.1 hypothetical protein M0R88_01145 [Halorussus gelatinilyticus]